jgi:hypothetical protein
MWTTFVRSVLAVQNTWIAYDDRRLYGFGWLFG